MILLLQLLKSSEKTNNFEVAIYLLLKVIGVRLELDRITIVQTDIKDREIYSDYQWNREGIPEGFRDGQTF